MSFECVRKVWLCPWNDVYIFIGLEMNNRIKGGSSMIGVYGRPYGSSSILSFDGSESRQSIDDTKQGNVFLLSSLIFMTIVKICICSYNRF